MKRSHFDEIQTALFMVRISGPKVLSAMGWGKRQKTAAWVKKFDFVTWEILAHKDCVPQVSRTDYPHWKYDLEEVLADKGEEIEND